MRKSCADRISRSFLGADRHSSVVAQAGSDNECQIALALERLKSARRRRWHVHASGPALEDRLPLTTAYDEISVLLAYHDGALASYRAAIAYGIDGTT